MADAGYPVLTSLIFMPLVASVVLFFIRQDGFVRGFTLVVGILECLLALPLFGYQPDGGYQFVEKAAWIPAWDITYHLGLDGLSLFMVMLTAVLLPLCVLCSWTYIKIRIKEFHFCLLLMTSACAGVFTALDFVLFYIFWEAMLVPMYLLIAVWGGPERKYASIKFFLYTLAGSTLLLAAIVAFRTVGGTFDIPTLTAGNFSFQFQFWTFLAMALAFAVKVPMFPLHTWLPAAHVQAPSAGSVLLAAVLLKMGTYGFLRFCLPLAPAASVYFAPLMIAISIASILYGGLIALGQKDIKKLVAYSSVAHMGFVTLGIFVFTQRGGDGAILQMLNHGITTGALFMLIGLVYERSHSRDIVANQGLGKYMPAFLFFWGLFSLSSLAFPGTNSFVGEVLVLAGTFEVNTWAGFLAIPGAMLAAAYMLRLLQLVAWGEPSSYKKTWLDLNGREWIYLLPMAFLVFYIGFVPGPALRMISPSITTVLTTVQDKNQALGFRQDMPLAECMKLEPAARVADGAAADVSLPGKERL
ncbi:complex I subunit 4 family protein [Desulfolutivibrio sulfoxidireducens]|uniref:complex I subunit 4 family protein n=1 Tax=Desulfolutivibrio sulfoxidireducens TaxID=2773299 RepID=UPI00159E321F|nr:NADH-quinone oxidoreductase subunit M [Desulfolutivibrio sulfoxidireducens]QLA14975.1 NADH-quinone oxidoreductase subunit M [Desulfolutivibrio sulfoxidireducens]QLA18542.1 NADH-quinone oxidoreductase subunit M [Desulfolutivibrio sulfoxidireducens]